MASNFYLMYIFIKVGLFSYGGGYAMLSMIEREIIKTNIIDSVEFINVVALSQMSPGPIAINAATYVGYTAKGFWGAVFATIGVCLPSIIFIIIISSFIEKFKNSNCIKYILESIRPVIIGMIFSVVIFFASHSIYDLDLLKVKELSAFSYTGIFIFCVTFLCIYRYKINPIYLIIFGGLSGAVLF